MVTGVTVCMFKVIGKYIKVLLYVLVGLKLLTSAITVAMVAAFLATILFFHEWLTEV